MAIRPHTLLLCLALLLGFGSSAHAARRVALLIGNGQYQHENTLPNPVRDVRLLASTLKGMDFKTEVLENLEKRDMDLAIKRFVRESAGADSAILYYAGHGQQPSKGGRSYLLPVNAKVQDDDSLETDGILAEDIAGQLERLPNPAKLRLVILDACRNTRATTRSTVRGLAPPARTDSYTLIAYSTDANSVAQDGSGANSPYAKALAKHLPRALKEPVRLVFEDTAKDVRTETKQQQLPRTYGDLESRVGLDGVLVASVGVVPTGQPVQATSQVDLEQEAWDLAKRRDTVAAYQAYLNRYPQGRFADTARVALEGLQPAITNNWPSQPNTQSEPQPARGDITIGISLPLTGPASGLGVPINNQIKLWPGSIAGSKLKVVVLDDATDSSVGVKNAKRFVTEDKVDIIMGSVATPVAIPIAGVAAEASTPHLSFSPAVLPPGRDEWTFRMPVSNTVMAQALVEHMKKQGIRTVGFLGYIDAYGESWLKDFTTEAEKYGIKVVAIERFARSDTSVTAQALKLVAASPDAMLVAASGSGAAMPHKSIVERGYRGKIYQTNAAATRDLIRLGGRDVEGAYVVTTPTVIAEQLPDRHPSKSRSIEFVSQYEKAYGTGSRNQFAVHAYDAVLVLEKIIPIALKKAKPGTTEFRAALRNAMETIGRTVVAHGVLNWTQTDHWGYTHETGVILKVENGDWKVE